MFRLVVLAVSLLVPALAEAHTGLGDAHGLAHGFAHPLGGADHVLAMVAVGLLAARIGGRALLLVPLAFVAVMAAGGALGAGGAAMPAVEIGVAASVAALGFAAALPGRLPLVAAMGLAGFFALFHGHAHGAEMPATASGLAYGLGFVAATALLHAAGIALGLGLGRLDRRGGERVVRLAGGATGLAGIGLLAGLI